MSAWEVPTRQYRPRPRGGVVGQVPLDPFRTQGPGRRGRGGDGRVERGVVRPGPSPCPLRPSPLSRDKGSTGSSLIRESTFPHSIPVSSCPYDTRPSVCLQTFKVCGEHLPQSFLFVREGPGGSGHDTPTCHPDRDSLVEVGDSGGHVRRPILTPVVPGSVDGPVVVWSARSLVDVAPPFGVTGRQTGRHDVQGPVPDSKDCHPDRDRDTCTTVTVPSRVPTPLRPPMYRREKKL